MTASFHAPSDSRLTNLQAFDSVACGVRSTPNEQPLNRPSQAQCYAELIGIWLPTFRETSVAWPLQVGPVGCFETSATKYQRCVTSRESENVIDTAAKGCHNAHQCTEYTTPYVGPKYVKHLLRCMHITPKMFPGNGRFIVWYVPKKKRRGS